MRYGPTDMLQGTTSCHLAEPWKVQMTDHFASHWRCDVSSCFGRCLISFSGGYYVLLVSHVLFVMDATPQEEERWYDSVDPLNMTSIPPHVFD